MKRVPFFDNPVLRGSLPMWRARLVLILIFAGFLTLVGRALFLQGLSTEFLQQQGERRYERTIPLPAMRGKILDRNGAVLASSVPARGVFAIPEDVKKASDEQMKALAKLLEMPVADIRARIDDDRNFVYLKRQVSVDVGDEIKALNVPGVHQLGENRRYYPDGEVMGHVVGFTNIEDRGQEGVELTFNDVLSGTAGSRRVIKDRLGRVIEDVQAIVPPVDGKDLRLSIDTRLQFVVYKALQDALEERGARAGAAVVIDVHTGEVLALANLPTFDPNRRETYKPANLRNMAITDTFEPGSIMKPFTAALALAEDSLTLDELSSRRDERLALVLGTEGDGLAAGTISAVDLTVRIPMSAGVDSLNVAAASAVAFWECRPQPSRP